jgi:hypothetical protein
MRSALAHIAAALSFAALAACGGSPQSLSYDQAAIEAPNGNVSTTDEAPAFGDPVIASEQLADTQEGSVTDAEDLSAVATGAKVYYVDIAWGHLRFLQHPALPPIAQADAGLLTPTTWDGKLCVSGAGMELRLLRRVRFEARTDSIVSRGPTCIEWKSQTLPAWDGIVARLVVGQSAAADASLSFTTAPLTTTLAVADLDGLHRIVDTGDANGDKVAFVATQGHAPCRVGFTDGRWLKLDPRGGVFMGRWVNRDGTLLGHVRGIFGTRRDGSHALFGKIIDSAGLFVGRLRGVFALGFFRAVFEGRDGGIHGVVFGRYDGDDGRGMFRGHWAEECATAPGSCQCAAGEPSASTPDNQPPCACR